MDELIKLVTKKVGITPEQAKSAVETVVGFLKQKLPAPVAGQITALLGGGGGVAADVKKGLGGLLKK
jgi:hypothetical protein